jgi:uncharacterized protein (TIGR03067 family)
MALRMVLASFAFLSLCGADEPKKEKDDLKKELELFQGDWVQSSVEILGKKFPDDFDGIEAKPQKITIKNNQWIMKCENLPDVISTFDIDPTKKPKSIDRSEVIGKLEISSSGIYKLEGDTLTICYNVVDKKRASEFKSTTEDGVLIILKRQKK